MSQDNMGKKKPEVFRMIILMVIPAHSKNNKILKLKVN